MLKLLLPLLLASAGAQADTPLAYGATDCRIGALLPAPTGGKVSWNGACKDGFAEGPGVLAWNDADDGMRRIEGTLARGSIAGEATLTWERDKKDRDAGGGRNSYIGTLRDGQPAGQGFFQYADGDMYEGGVANGKPEGNGISIGSSRSKYEGHWVDGKRDGKGKATFALGGSYDGEWKNGLFDGTGTIVFAGTPRTWTGRFRAGRPEDTVAPTLAGKGRFSVTSDENAYGSRMRAVVATGYMPPRATWAQLSAEQQNYVKAFYSTLAPGDEPPFPLHGMQASTELVSKIHVSDGLPTFRGTVGLIVLVGADGKAKSATVIGKVPQDIARYISAAMMVQPYKPAMCQGTPCEMAYPIGFALQ